jgi:hypothetical protein
MHFSVTGPNENIRITIAGPETDGGPGADRAGKVYRYAIGFHRCVARKDRFCIAAKIAVKQKLAVGIACKQVDIAIRVL